MEKFRKSLVTVTLLVLIAVTVNVSLPTLETLDDLKRTGFGRPPPRHGYVLLIWYVQNCVDNNMVSLSSCDPKTGEYGFHYFGNKAKSGQALLPKLEEGDGYKYYTLGNLNGHHYKKAQDLPEEVRKYYDKRDPTSNMDRLLVKYMKNKNTIVELYASAHYSSSATYLISQSLIELIREQTMPQQLGLQPYHWDLIIVNSPNILRRNHVKQPMTRKELKFL